MILSQWKTFAGAAWLHVGRNWDFIEGAGKFTVINPWCLLTSSPPYKGEDSKSHPLVLLDHRVRLIPSVHCWQYLKPNTRTVNTKCRALVQLIPETLLSLVFCSITEASFRVPHGTVKNLNIGLLVLGASTFYLYKHSCTEPPTLSFQGSVHPSDARFLTWLLTFPHTYSTNYHPL